MVKSFAVRISDRAPVHGTYRQWNARYHAPSNCCANIPSGTGAWHVPGNGMLDTIHRAMKLLDVRSRIQ